MMTDTDFIQIAQNKADIQSRIDKAVARRANAHKVTLVAVSKVQPDSRIEAGLASGQRVFAENRVQEGQKHWDGRRAAYSDLQLRLIGPLQTNKAEDAIRLFDVIETLDRPKLARALAKAMIKLERRPDILIQINTGEEPQKAGVSPKDFPELCALTKELGLPVRGLMCIPPAAEPAGPHFALLAKLAAQYDLDVLSMGMSADYETAISFGATHVRVGSAFFGARET
jgi:pyridoxal phosphate enzyme (YggS family)